MTVKNGERWPGLHGRTGYTLWQMGYEEWERRRVQRWLMRFWLEHFSSSSRRKLMGMTQSLWVIVLRTLLAIQGSLGILISAPEAHDWEARGANTKSPCSSLILYLSFLLWFFFLGHITISPILFPSFCMEWKLKKIVLSALFPASF